MEDYRAKVSKRIGRKLESSEEVHHKDGDQHNNEDSNLQIVKGKSAHRKLDAKVNVKWKEKLLALTQEKGYKDTPITEALNQFFTERQQYIMYRKLAGLELSKTEREYYSRTIKKKLKAIAHPKLHDISRQLAWELM